MNYYAKLTIQDYEIAEKFFENERHLDEFCANVIRYYNSKPLTIKTKLVKKYFESYKKTMNFVIGSREFGKNGGDKRIENQSYTKDTLEGVVEQVLEPIPQPKLTKVNRNKSKLNKAEFVPPEFDEVLAYFRENGYSEKSAKTAFLHYEDLDWHNTFGKKIASWKGTMRTVWFKDENIAPKTEGKIRILKTTCEGNKSEVFMSEQELANYTGSSQLRRIA